MSRIGSSLFIWVRRSSLKSIRGTSSMECPPACLVVSPSGSRAFKLNPGASSTFACDPQLAARLRPQARQLRSLTLVLGVPSHVCHTMLGLYSPPQTWVGHPPHATCLQPCPWASCAQSRSRRVRL
ncbi:hypothetical protein PISMIDRAFT_689121 [Pisolithus microcarpus 441]|uniref:Uncharacterized protein n=1 Tax=Pisolithus microcarpus 441 TaxID=765257 RepID=A0A0C9XKS7_9AGAM|nr:hypothetical protein BKA83DRAFT_689121 [Pisolithus microcarpus]KIK12910.1 hypothetical protein PISMIDRAFT_689121 [Pisolithus microcarpus 441]